MKQRLIPGIPSSTLVCKRIHVKCGIEKYEILFSTILGYVDCWISILLLEVVHTSIHSRWDDVKPIRIRLHVHGMISKDLLHSY
jgi:hypothetical protein